MNINPKTIRFFIRKIQDQFAIVVKYKDLEVIACKGAMNYCKTQFIRIVNNRNLLIPIVQRAMAK